MGWLQGILKALKGFLKSPESPPPAESRSQIHDFGADEGGMVAESRSQIHDDEV